VPKGEYLQYGGQAIFEGVMMRSPRFFSVACRAPNGKIVLKAEPLEKTWIGRQRWLKLPFLRGTLGLLDAIALGIRSMRFAANVQLDPAWASADGPPVAPGNKNIQNIAVGGAVVVGLALGVLLFTVLPNALAEAGLRGQPGTLVNYVTEVIKVVFFIGYIWLISRMSEIKRLFQYHGAEHKAINVLEAGGELGMEACQAQSRLHPRCGTSFAVIVLIVGFLLFPLVPRYPLTLWTGEQHHAVLDVMVRIGMELVILPVVAGISYELLRIAGRFRNQRFVMALFSPGLATQYITTQEPDEGQVEVAVVALQAVLDAERDGQVASEDARTLDAAEGPPPCAEGADEVPMRLG
jgi:uncharacterized protein YqhQ